MFSIHHHPAVNEPRKYVLNTPDYIYPIIVPSDSNVEDAFSSTTTPNYTPSSPDYSLASSGNTSPDPSDDLSKYLLASLAISPFHDDPYNNSYASIYLLVMDYTNSTTSSNAPQTVLPLSPMIPLSPMFDPQNFFLPEEILPPKKRDHELSLEHIEEMEGHVDGQVIIQQDFDKLKTELQKARAQIAGLQRKQMRHNDNIIFARFMISTLELIIKDI
ncbi:hypothetical protein Tco_0537119 [Tanacetum coccineum]